jgi:hypothetical protein
MQKRYVLKQLKNCIRAVGSVIKKAAAFGLKMIIMDWNWYVNKKDCFNDIPPSYYCTHTEEEVAQLKAERIEKLRVMLDNFVQEQRLLK